MTAMDESTLLAHALRNYLRGFVDESELSFVDSPLDAGEPYSAITGALAIAQHSEVALPPLFIERITALPGWSADDHDFLEMQISSLPQWWELAS